MKEKGKEKSGVCGFLPFFFVFRFLLWLVDVRTIMCAVAKYRVDALCGVVSPKRAASLTPLFCFALILLFCCCSHHASLSSWWSVRQTEEEERERECVCVCVFVCVCKNSVICPRTHTQSLSPLPLEQKNEEPLPKYYVRAYFESSDQTAFLNLKTQVIPGFLATLPDS